MMSASWTTWSPCRTTTPSRCGQHVVTTAQWTDLIHFDPFGLYRLSLGHLQRIFLWNSWWKWNRQCDQEARSFCQRRVKVRWQLLPKRVFELPRSYGYVEISQHFSPSDNQPIFGPVHFDTCQAVTCERAFLAALDGNCKTPIAGWRVTGLEPRITKPLVC